MSEELRPCPFCGAMPMGEDDRYMCSTLGCVMQEDTISAKDWNTRPIEDALRARIAELEEQVWIPVGERLPEVYRDGDGEFIPFLVCENDKDYPYRAIYDGLNWGDGMFVADVTHWMPLPKPPEVQE